MRNAAIRRWIIAGTACPIVALLAACATPVSGPLPTAVAAANADVLDAQQVRRIADSAADWQIANMDNPKDWIRYISGETENPRGWVQATYLLGLEDYAAATGQRRYTDALEAIAVREKWRLADRLYHADDHLIGQVYFKLADAGVQSANLAPTKASLDAILANRPTNTLRHHEQEGDPRCHDRWCWADALFMAPATWWEAARIFDNDAYAKFAHEEFVASTELLFDPQEALYFRDSRFFDQLGDDGEKIFWSRGNGWVYGGLVNLLRDIDKTDPRRAYYLDLFVKMSDRIVGLQTEDGMWRSSLLATSPSPPETSGTGFFTYGLAWGVNEGILRGPQYEQAANKGWTALASFVDDEGRLGYVQQVGASPAGVKPDDRQYYGTGALLFAASQMIRLAGS